MYKLQYMNIIVETNDEMTKNVLISEGYELIEDIKDDKVTDETGEGVENSQEIADDVKSDEKNQDEEQAEDNNDETENKAGKKSGKAKK